MTTRRRPSGSPPPQERFASSRTMAPGILANLAAKAIAKVPDRSTRALLWWIQWRSWQGEGLEDLWKEVRSAVEESDSISNSPFACLMRPEASEDALDRIRCLCLDPNALKQPIGETFWAWLRPYLEQIQTQERKSAMASIAKTTVASQIWTTLEDVSCTRCAALITGLPLTGKATTARAWCGTQCGMARIVDTPPGNDLGALLRAIAEALGTASGSGYKANQVEERVLRALESGEIVLVFNNAHRLWPSGDVRLSYPKRLEWLLTIMDRPKRVPIVMIATLQWAQSRRIFAEVFGWAVQQLEGHLGSVLVLSDPLTASDYCSIAANMLPKAEPEIHQELARFGMACFRRGLGGMVSMIREANIIAQSRKLDTPDLDCIRIASTRARATETTLDMMASDGERN